MLSIDKAGFRGELLWEWRNPEGLGLDVMVPPTTVEPTSYFTAEDFRHTAEAGALTGPGGVTTPQRRRNREGQMARWTSGTLAPAAPGPHPVSVDWAGGHREAHGQDGAWASRRRGQRYPELPDSGLGADRQGQCWPFARVGLPSSSIVRL